jgi:glycerol-3-phosphate dehydrogenase
MFWTMDDAAAAALIGQRPAGRRRPLIGASATGGGRELWRTFRCFAHAATDGVEGFVTITGGKATTLRAMAEATADLVCRKLGVDAPCRTRDTVLAPHTAHCTARAA